MFRTQVYLRDEQHALLKLEARRRNLSMTELLRDLLDRHLGRDAGRAGPNLAVITALGRGRDPQASLRHDEVFGRSAGRRPR